MNIFLYFAILLAIIGFQIISCHLAYKRNELKKANEIALLNKPLMVGEDAKKRVNKDLTGHYAITHKESLTPQVKASMEKRQSRVLEKI